MKPPSLWNALQPYVLREVLAAIQVRASVKCAWSQTHAIELLYCWQTSHPVKLKQVVLVWVLVWWLFIRLHFNVGEHAFGEVIHGVTRKC